jgi:hypothetical protein
MRIDRGEFSWLHQALEHMSDLKARSQALIPPYSLQCRPSLSGEWEQSLWGRVYGSLWARTIIQKGCYWGSTAANTHCSSAISHWTKKCVCGLVGRGELGMHPGIYYGNRTLKTLEGMEGVWSTSLGPLKIEPSHLSGTVIIDRCVMKRCMDETPSHGPWGSVVLHPASWRFSCKPGRNKNGGDQELQSGSAYTESEKGDSLDFLLFPYSSFSQNQWPLFETVWNIH